MQFYVSSENRVLGTATDQIRPMLLKNGSFAYEMRACNLVSLSMAEMNFLRECVLQDKENLLFEDYADLVASFTDDFLGE